MQIPNKYLLHLSVSKMKERKSVSLQTFNQEPYILPPPPYFEFEIPWLYLLNGLGNFMVLRKYKNDYHTVHLCV